MAESQKRIVVGFLLENAAEFKQDLTSIREAAEGFGAEGVKSAQELVDAFDRIELGAGKVTKKISDGRTVSDRDLAAMKQAYGLLEQQIEATFGSLEQAPADIQKAFKNAEAQIGAAVSAIRQVNIAAEDASEKFDDLGRKVDAVAGLVEETKKLPVALDRAEEMVAKFNNKLQAESDVSKGDLEAIWRSQIQLNDAIKRGEINLKDLGEEGKRRLEEVRQAAKNAEAEFVRMERATDQQAAKMKLGAGDVGSAGTAMFGTFSKVAGVMTLVIGLVLEFKGRIVDIANWLGLRGDAIQSWMDAISARVQVILRSAVDTFRNYGDLIGKLIEAWKTKNVELAKQALADLQNASQKTLDGLIVGFSGSNAEVEKLAASLGITTAAAERNKEGLGDAAEAAKRLAEEKAKLRGEIDDVSRSLAKETAELERQQAIAGSSEWKAVDSSGQLGAAQLQVRQLEQSVEQLRQKLAEQIATWGEDSAGAKRAAAELAEYEAMLDKARIRAEQLSEATEKYREEQERATEAAKDSQERVNDLKERHGQLTEELTKLTGATETGTAATRTWTSEVVGHVEKLEDGKTKYVIGQAAMRQASAESMAAVEAAMGKDQEAAKAKEESASATEKAATAVEQMAAKMNAVNIDALQTRVEKLNTALDAVVAKANAAVAAMEKLAKLGDDDDDGDDGITITRAGGEPIKPGTLGGGFKGQPTGR